MRYLLKTRFMMIALLLFFVGASDLFAQGRGGRNMDPAKAAAEQLTAMTEALGLSDEQVAQVGPILQGTLEKQLKMRDSMRAGGGDRASMREKLGELNDMQNTQLAEVLSEEQMVKYKEWRKEMQKARRGGRGQGRPGDRGTR